MATTAQTRPLVTLADAFWPTVTTQSRAIRNVALAVVGACLLTLSAKVSVPGPVPMTMQTFVVLVLGTAYGWRLGAATVLFYLAQGAAGLPVFAQGAGVAYMMGSTGGFLAGFVVAAALCGWAAERGWDRNLLLTAIAMTVGHVVILGLGFLYLSTLVGVAKAWQFGVAPFYLATLLKTALAVAVMPLAWRLVRS